MPTSAAQSPLVAPKTVENMKVGRPSAHISCKLMATRRPLITPCFTFQDLCVAQKWPYLTKTCSVSYVNLLQLSF